MADILTPYRPYDLLQSGLDSAGEGIAAVEKQNEANKPEHPLVVQYIRNALTQKGVPPDKQQPYVDRALAGLNSASIAKGAVAPVASGTAPTAVQQGGLTQQPQPLVAETQPAGMQQAAQQAQGLALDSMKGGVPKNTFTPGPAQQSLFSPSSGQQAAPAPAPAPAPAQAQAQQPAPAQAPHGQRISRTSSTPSGTSSPQWTRGDTARNKDLVNNAVASKSREDVASIQAEGRAVVEKNKNDLRRELATMRTNNSNLQLAAKLEQGASLAMARLDVQQQNNYFDFAADIIRMNNELEKLSLQAQLKQGDWQVKLLEIQQRVAAMRAGLAGRMAGSLNFDREMKAVMEQQLQDVTDLSNNIMRGGDLLSTQRGEPELVRPEGAKNSRGQELQQGVPNPEALPAQKGSAPPAPAKMEEPKPEKTGKKPGKKAGKTEPKTSTVTPQASTLLQLMGKGK